jgi:hypothetical protein
VRYAANVAIVLLIGCAGPPSHASGLPASTQESQPVTVAGVLILGEADEVQGRPATEELIRASQKAWYFAKAHRGQIGYPWVDPATDELVLSAATQNGLLLLEGEAAQLTVAFRIRWVTHSFADLQRIQEEVTHLRGDAVPGADLIWATYPDYRDNRTVIRISEMHEPLLVELARRFGADAIAIQVLANPGLAPQ